MAEKKTVLCRDGKRRGRKPVDRSWYDPFLRALASTANVRLSCHTAGIGRKEAYLRRKADEDFAAKWDEAVEDACDLLEAEARKRAMAASDTLLIFLLKAHRPGVYREHLKVDATVELRGQIEELLGRLREKLAPGSYEEVIRAIAALG